MQREQAASAPLVAFVAASSDSLITRFRAKLVRGGAAHWWVLTAMDLLRSANETEKLLRLHDGSTPADGESPWRKARRTRSLDELVALVDMWALASTTRLYRPPFSSLSRTAAVWRKEQRPTVLDVFDAGQPHCALAETLNSDATVRYHNGQVCEQVAGHVVRCQRA